MASSPVVETATSPHSLTRLKRVYARGMRRIITRRRHSGLRVGVHVVIVACVLALTRLVADVVAASDGDAERSRDEPVPLPTRDDGADDGVPVRQIKFGEKIRLDEFGPVVINADCTTSHIENWGELTTRERATTFRRIGARNRERQAECQRKERDGEL